ncbi:MAG: hypothetical protein IT433_12965 [Phycisphaerales bacterium]|nr:hypothetical protein [Phycisphaerales bacterium]
MILYLATDLIWASKIKATANALGLSARPVRTLEMLEARLADADPVAMLLDLDAADLALAMLARVRDPALPTARRLKVLAWGPHVATDLLQKARDLGADEVLTRGAFDHAMDDILPRLASASATPDRP